jgi:hypothetical protein
MTVLAAVVALAGAVVALASLVVLHVLPTGLSGRRDPVSQYGITRFRAGYRTAAVAAGVAGIGVAALLGQAEGRWSVAGVLLLVFAAARLLIPFFPMDAPGAAGTSRGRMHLVLADVAFGTVIIAAYRAAAVPGDVRIGALEPRVQAGVALLCAIVMSIGVVGLVLGRAAPRLLALFGLFVRLIYVGFLAWFVVVGILVLA